MLSRRPRLKIEAGQGSEAGRAPSSFTPLSSTTVEQLDYPNVSTFRSDRMEITIHSPSVKTSRWHGQEVSQPLPVFGDRDRVGGTIALLPHSSTGAGRFVLNFEGVFLYVSPDAEVRQGTASNQYRHVFFSSSVTVSPVSPSADVSSPLLSANSFRSAFSVSVRSRGQISRKGSMPTLPSSAQRPLPFSFEIPQPTRPGEEMPPTFFSSVVSARGVHARAAAEHAEVSYKIVAVWEPADELEAKDIFEIPVLFQPDSEFLSLDGLSFEPESWLEIPLRSDRPIPIQCAVTLPSPAHFPRNGAIQYFVVFHTTPKSPALAREIAADATISVSLFRQVTINPTQAAPSLSLSSSSVLSSASAPSSPPTSASDESDSQATSSLYIPRRSRLLSRVVRSAPPILQRTPAAPTLPQPPPQSAKNKPLPDLPTAISESRILHTDVSIGFPKRPRQHTGGAHPSLEEQKALPDGLYKGKMPLDKSMLPCVDWAGLGIKYYLEVSVLFEQDDMRARVPVRIF